MKITSCEASTNQDGYHCSAAGDGFEGPTNNGWAIASNVPAWAKFYLERPTDLSNLRILNGYGRGNHRLVKFKVRLQVDNNWVQLEGLRVQGSWIDNDGIVNMYTAREDLHMDFNTAFNVTGVKLKIHETDL